MVTRVKQTGFDYYMIYLIFYVNIYWKFIKIRMFYLQNISIKEFYLIWHINQHFRGILNKEKSSQWLSLIIFIWVFWKLLIINYFLVFCIIFKKRNHLLLLKIYPSASQVLCHLRKCIYGYKRIIQRVGKDKNLLKLPKNLYILLARNGRVKWFFQVLVNVLTNMLSAMYLNVACFSNHRKR